MGRNIQITFSILILSAGLVSSVPADQANPMPTTVITSVDSTKVPMVSPMPEPVQPKGPDCFGYFPGTPGWRECFNKFTQSMANYQKLMHEFVKNKAQLEDGGTTLTQAGPGQYYSQSAYNSNSMSTSNSFVGGYAIRAVNMGISSSLNNNILKVTLHAGPIDKFDSKVNGNEIVLNVLSKGHQKWVKILVPKGVSIKDVSVDRTSDTIYITGPTANDGGYQYSQSSSSGSSSSSSNINQNFGQPGAQMAPLPLPDFQNYFQNMFQNMFQGIFQGARGFPTPKNAEEYAAYGEKYIPQVWFF